MELYPHFSFAYNTAAGTSIITLLFGIVSVVHDHGPMSILITQ
jgi:hypothetical protein